MSDIHEDEVDKLRYQLFYNTKETELLAAVYPTCLEDCLATYPHPKKESSRVFQKDQLSCSMNCIQKYKHSFSLALAVQQMAAKGQMEAQEEEPVPRQQYRR